MVKGASINYSKSNVIPFNISKLVDQAVKGEIDIPEFQRDFVWSKDQIKELLDSLVKGFPVGSFLIWDMSEYTMGKHVNEGKTKNWIVDGQQRIVSLSILTRRKPYWLDINQWNNLINKYLVKVNILTLEVSLEYPVIKNNPEWLYVHQVLGFDDDEKAAQDLSTKLHDQKLYSRIFKNIWRIKDVMDGVVPYVTINASLEDIATVFERINSMGTRVKMADVTLAYIAAYNPGWIRDNFIKYIDALEEEGFYFEPTLLIKALTAVGENKVILKEVSDDFLQNKNGALDASFGKLKLSLNTIIHVFRDFGIMSSGLVYAKNTMIALIYLNSRFPTEFEPNKALHFFLLALKTGRYSGSSDSKMREDIVLIKESKNFEEAISKLHIDMHPIELDKNTVLNAVHYQGEGKFYKLILYLIAFKSGANDWFSKTRLGYLPLNEINKDFTIEEHHFFPKTLLNSIGEEEDKRESIANISFINPGTNKRLRVMPYLYIQKFNIDKKELEKQLIPTHNDELLKLDNFDEFLNKRSIMISKGINEFVRNLYPSYYDTSMVNQNVEEKTLKVST